MEGLGLIAICTFNLSNRRLQDFYQRSCLLQIQFKLCVCNDGFIWNGWRLERLAMDVQIGVDIPNFEIDVDLPPPSRTSLNSRKSVNQENDGHEEEQIHRRTNHWLHQAGRGRHADQGA